MCGFAAVVDLDGRGRAGPWALAALRHRGPDGEGTATDEGRNVALEHCRLAIIDPANREADQPFFDDSREWAIAYNGEIFNFRALREELVRDGIRPRTQSDTEVVLLGYIYHGEAYLERLRGMYAFVIWNRRTGELFAARDPVGVKPFYWALQNGLFLACSEVRPLIGHPAFDVEVDAEGVVEFLAFGSNFGEQTVVRDLRKLLPGHQLRVRSGKVIVSEFWDAIPPVRAIDDEPTARATLVDLLGEAVRDSLVSDVPVGLMLSGGIDSSLIAGLAARETNPSELTCYSVAFGESDDEADAAARLALDLGAEHRVVSVGQSDVEQVFPRWLEELDYPSGDPTLIATWFIAAAARRDGLKVLLSGDGPDELFGGYNRWMKYLAFHDRVWGRSPDRLRRIAGRAAVPLARGLAGDIARRAGAGRDLFVPSRPLHDDGLLAVLGPAGLAAAGRRPPECAIQGLRTQFDERNPGADYLAWMSYVSLKTKLVEDYLQRLDKMGMRHGVEGRVPLLDARLARFAFEVSQSVKAPGLRQKALVRSAAAALLPSYVLERPKQGFCPPTAQWAENLLLAAPITDSPLVESGIVREDARAAVSRIGRTAAFGSWTLAILDAWVNQNVVREPLGVAVTV